MSPDLTVYKDRNLFFLKPGYMNKSAFSVSKARIFLHPLFRSGSFGSTAMNINWPSKFVFICLVHLSGTNTLWNNTLKNSNLDFVTDFFSDTVGPFTVTSQ